MDLEDNVFNLFTLIDEEWLNGGAINSVLSQLAALLSGVQLMSSTKAFLNFCRLNVGKLIESVIDLQFSTHMIMFPFNLSGIHWCVAVAACDNRNCLLTIYNSMSIQDADFI